MTLKHSDLTSTRNAATSIQVQMENYIHEKDYGFILTS